MRYGMMWDDMGWYGIRVEDGGESEATTSELTEFIEKAKMGEITNQDIPKFAKMFKVRASGFGLEQSIAPSGLKGWEGGRKGGRNSPRSCPGCMPRVPQ